jgi:hypothetical protein
MRQRTLHRAARGKEDNREAGMALSMEKVGMSEVSENLEKATYDKVFWNYEHVHGENVRATLFTATPSSGANQTIVSLGIRHRF